MIRQMVFSGEIRIRTGGTRQTKRKQNKIILYRIDADCGNSRNRFERIIPCR
jgi:hypothetical protein